MIFVQYPFPCEHKVLNFGSTFVHADLIEDDIGSYLGCHDFSLFYNGKKLPNEAVVPNDSTVHVAFPLPGGKGGFGSMLRAIGAQIEKTTNREACRDLSGRRLRDINEEQRLKKWIAKEAEREAEKIRRRQARIERLKSKAPHQFFDFEYEKKISELPERIDDALNEGLQKIKQPKKRSHEDSKETKLPKKSWLNDDMPSSSDSDSDEAHTSSNISPSKKIKLIPRESSSCDSEMSESSLSCPGSSKDSYFIPEESTSSNSQPSSSKDCSSTAEESSFSKLEEHSIDSDKMDITQCEDDVTKDKNCASGPEMKNVTMGDVEMIHMDKSATSSEAVKGDKDQSKIASNESSSIKEPEEKDDLPIDLLDFQNPSELEALGLERLKSALMARGLKCGGTLSDRAQRLWKIRGLKPDKYPANLLAKNKK